MQQIAGIQKMSKHSWRFPVDDKGYHDFDKIDPLDTNADVIVDLPDGRSFAVTFFTVRNLRTLMQKHREAGEAPYGHYIFGSNMIVVESFTRQAADAAVTELVRSGDIERIGIAVLTNNES